MHKIEDLSVEQYAVPVPDALDDATQTFDVLEVVVVKVTTEAAVQGLGFTYTIGEGGAAIASFVANVLEPVVIGRQLQPRSLYAAMRAATTFVGREGISELAISAVDIACWDGLARTQDLPLYALLGAGGESIPAYDTSRGWLQYDEDTLAANAEAVAAEGFAGMKMKVGRSVAEDVSRIRTVRAALPATCDLMLDANCGLTVQSTRRLCRALDDLDIAWLEEPLEKGDHAGYADVRDRVDVPLAAGENCYSPDQFGQLLAVDGIDVLQPDVCRVGGVTGWLQVAALAATRQLPIAPHYIEPIHAHLVQAAPTTLYLERHSSVLEELLSWDGILEDGTFTPGRSAGHGLALRDEQQYRVNGRTRS